jgi:hypothetical protein
MFVFDDVIDLGAAERCGARFLVGRGAQPLVEEYARRHGLADYVVRSPGGAGAVREACEVVLALLGIADEVIHARGWFEDGFRAYLKARSTVPPARRFRALREGGLGAEERVGEA